MLRIRPNNRTDSTWREVLPDAILDGLVEDCDYLLEVAPDVVDLAVDDERLLRDPAGHYCWRVTFYAGRVVVETRSANATSCKYQFDVSPSPFKSGQLQFDEMVQGIRDVDPSLLLGTSAASMAFGDRDRCSPFELDVLLQRVRRFGPPFLSATATIARSPHRALAADLQAQPLSRLRRLHHSAFRSGRVVRALTEMRKGAADSDGLLVSGVQPALTFDTPANRALLALLRRFTAMVRLLADAVTERRLAGEPDDQSVRAAARLRALQELSEVAGQAISAPLFAALTRAEISSAGLTQIAANPDYSRACRLGNRALSSHIAGPDADTALNVPPSWGIYETWCYIQVVRAVSRLSGSKPVERASHCIRADRCASFLLPDGRELEVLFQAVFPSWGRTHLGDARSLSGERRPDIVLLLHGPAAPRCFILDAKWRSKPRNILNAMESAHIYHDALRVGDCQPECCVLLLPGDTEVRYLEDPVFIEKHGVGTVAGMRVGGAGYDRLLALTATWLQPAPPA